MLVLADKQFDLALTLTGSKHYEPWIYQFMLGKISMKLNRQPQAVLQHFVKVHMYIYIYIYTCIPTEYSYSYMYIVMCNGITVPIVCIYIQYTLYIYIYTMNYVQFYPLYI